MNERLKEFRKKLKLNQHDFSAKIGISQSALTLMENGKRAIRDVYISQMVNIFNLNENWLRTGEGEMFVQSNTFSLDEKAKQHNLSELEIDIMRGYMELPVATRKDLVELFGSIYNKHSGTAASVEVDPIEEELESYRKELEAEKKGTISLVSEDSKTS